MKKLNFVFIALLACLFISCKQTPDFSCEHCDMKYFTPEEAEECSKHIGCPYGYLSDEAKEKYIYSSEVIIADTQDLENAQKLYKEACEYVKNNDTDEEGNSLDDYKDLCTLDFSNVLYVIYDNINLAIYILVTDSIAISYDPNGLIMSFLA